jgi:putative transposase
VQKYLAGYPSRRPDPSQRWLSFVRNHAHAILACDFFVVVTARFRILYVFVIMELGTRRLLHHNVTAHPTAEWTLQQFREALSDEPPYQFVIHDRDNIFSKELDHAVSAMGVQVLRTPVRAPKANAICERLVSRRLASARRRTRSTSSNWEFGPASGRLVSMPAFHIGANSFDNGERRLDDVGAG